MSALGICPFCVCCPLKAHTYLNKPATESCRFVYLCMTFLWTPDTKALSKLGEKDSWKAYFSNIEGHHPANVIETSPYNV